MKLFIRLAATDTKPEKEENEKEYYSKRIFFARSRVCPKAWFFDHVGFYTTTGLFLQISSHRRNDGVYTLRKVDEDSAFDHQEATLVEIPKRITITDGKTEALNCVAFVVENLNANGIKVTDSDFNRYFRYGLKQLKPPLKRVI